MEPEQDDLAIALKALDLNKQQLIYQLPPEILARILAFVALDNGKAFQRAARSARVFSISKTSTLFWMHLCQQNYKDYEHAVLKYSSYYDLFMNRPHPRFNGVYVCTSSYYRQAEQQNGSWYQQLMEVTYYRYIRLFEDGKCQTLVTVKEPELVLPFEENWSKGPVNKGQWRIDQDKNILALNTTMEKGYRGYFSFKVLSQSGPVHNVLRWRALRVKGEHMDEWDNVPIEREGNFFFKRLDVDSQHSMGDNQVNGNSIYSSENAA